MRAFLFLSAVVIGVSGQGRLARAEFVPGRLYITATFPEPGCIEHPSVNERVYEFDPLTGQSKIFATIPHTLCGLNGGLEFTPDGSRLRAVSLYTSSILDISPDGRLSIAYDAADGITAPGGYNNLAFDTAGNFYVGQVTKNLIMKFPNDTGPGQLLVKEAPPNMFGPGSLDVAPDGDLYFTANGGLVPQVLHIKPDGSYTSFLPPAGTAMRSLTVDSEENVYVSLHGTLKPGPSQSHIFVYPGGDPSAAYSVWSGPGGSGFPTIRLSADEQTLYAVVGTVVFQLDIAAGRLTKLGDLPPFWVPGAGLALYIPEPSASLVAAFGAFVAYCRRRHR